MADEFDTFSKLPAFYFEVGGARLYFPVTNLKTTYRNRIAKHRRLYRDGARCDDVGGLEEVFEVSGIIHEGAEDPAVLGQDIPPYPDLANRLEASFRVHEVGEIMHPRKGIIRVRAEELTLVERAEDRACAGYVAVFCEDNEEDADEQALKPANGLVGQFTDLAEFIEDAKESSTADIRETLGRIATALNGPSPEAAITEYALQYGTDLAEACKSIGLAIEAHEPVGKESSDQMSTYGMDESTEQTRDRGSPRNQRTPRLVEQVRDRAHRTKEEGRQGAPQLVPLTFPVAVNLFDVARDVKMDLERLMSANPKLDAFYVPPNTPILVELARRVAA